MCSNVLASKRMAIERRHNCAIVMMPEQHQAIVWACSRITCSRASADVQQLRRPADAQPARASEPPWKQALARGDGGNAAVEGGGGNEAGEGRNLAHIRGHRDSPAIGELSSSDLLESDDDDSGPEDAQSGADEVPAGEVGRGRSTTR